MLIFGDKHMAHIRHLSEWLIFIKFSFYLNDKNIASTIFNNFIRKIYFQG